MTAILERTRTIRPLTKAEIPLCFPSGLSFYAEVSLPGRFSAEHFQASWERFYDLEMGVIIGLWEGEAYVGGIGGILAPNPNTGDLTAVECFWYVLPEHRGARKGIQLVRAFEVWAKGKGASQLIMVFVHGRKDSHLNRLYERLGFRSLETNYVKEL